MPASRYEFGLIRYLINRREADSKSARRIGARSLVLAGNQAKGMKVASVALRSEEGAAVGRELLSFAVREDSIVPDLERALVNSEHQPSGSRVICVLNELKGES